MQGSTAGSRRTATRGGWRTDTSQPLVRFPRPRARVTAGRVDPGAIDVQSVAEIAAIRARERGESPELAVRLQAREAQGGGGMSEGKKLARIKQLLGDY